MQPPRGTSARSQQDAGLKIHFLAVPAAKKRQFWDSEEGKGAKTASFHFFRKAVVRSAVSAASPEGFSTVIQSAVSAASPTADNSSKELEKSQNTIFNPHQRCGNSDSPFARIGGWGERTNREIVSFHLCVHTRGRAVWLSSQNGAWK